MRAEVAPRGPFRLPRRNGMDGMLRRRGRACWSVCCTTASARAGARLADRARPRAVRGLRGEPRGGRVRDRADALRARRRRRPAALPAGASPGDPLIGASLRRRPWLRVPRRPEPFEALAWAICEQLIEYERAAAIERRIRQLGRRWVGWHGGDGTLARPARARGAGRHLAGAAAVAGPRRLPRAHARAGGPRGRARARRPARRPITSAAGGGCGDPGDRPLDGRDAGPARAGPPRPGTRGRPGAAQARRAGCARAATRRRWPRSEVRELFAPYGEWAGLAAAHAIGL